MRPRVELLRHFSVPIYTALVADFAERQGELVAFLRAMAARVPSQDLTNRNSWHSSQDLHTLGEETPVRWAIARIDEIARAALADLYEGFRTTEPRVVESWAVVGGRGAWHTPHHHYPRAWSGVLYVSAEHCIAEAPNDRSGKIEFLNPIPVAPAFFSAGSVAYNPRDGLVILFPGALQHLVHPNTTDGSRIVMSFNLDIARTTIPREA